MNSAFRKRAVGKGPVKMMEASVIKDHLKDAYKLANFGPGGMMTKESLSGCFTLEGLEKVIGHMGPLLESNGDGYITKGAVLEQVTVRDGLVNQREFEEAFLDIHREVERQRGAKKPTKYTASGTSDDHNSHVPGITETPDDEYEELYNASRGSVNIRTRMHEVFRASDINGKPVGILDHVELKTKWSKEKLVSALEGAITIKDDGERAYPQEVAAAVPEDASGKISFQQLQDAFVSAMKIEVAAPVPMAIASKVKQLFTAMDTDSDGMVSKMEFVEFIRENKPKYGPWSTVAKLMTGFGFASHGKGALYEISPEGFQTAFDRLASAPKGQQLSPEDFEFDFADGSDGMFMPVPVSASERFLGASP